MICGMMAIIGFLIWLVVAVAVLGFVAWSTNILMAQKKAWSEFAARYKLEVVKGRKFVDPWAVRGQLNGRQIIVYSNIEQSEREHTQRVYSHVEVYLNAPPAVKFILSKKPLPEAIAGVTLPSVFTGPSPDWPQLAVSQCDDVAALGAWMTHGRMTALRAFTDLAVHEIECLLVCDGENAFMLWRGENPLRDPRELNALVQKLYGYAKEFDDTAWGISANPNPAREIPPSAVPVA